MENRFAKKEKDGRLFYSNPRKIIKYEGNKYTLGELLGLWKEQGSLAKVSGVTHIPYPKLYRIFRKYFGKKIFKIKKQVGFIKGKNHGYTYNLKEIVRFFKKYGFLPYVSQATGIPIGNLRQILIREFGMGLFELRKKLGIRKSCLKRRALDKKAFRFQQVKEAYDRLGTLEKAGKELGLTRQRISQILSKGKKLGLFSYERKARNLRILKRELSREILIKDIESLFSKTKICLKYNINHKKLGSLLRYFNIDLKEYQRATRAGKYMRLYSKIVDDLGRHPTTTELNTRPDWNKVWKGIGRHWGNFDNFRKEFGIPKPERRIPERLRERFEKSRLKRLEILDFLKENLGQISSREISLKLDIPLSALYNYVSKFRKEGMLPKSDIHRISDRAASERRQKVLSLIQGENTINIEEISNQLWIDRGTVYRDIYKLRKNGEFEDNRRYYKRIVRRRGSGEERKIAVLKLIKENNTITAVEIAAKLGVHRTRIYEIINDLHREGRLVESDRVPWKRRTTGERKSILLNLIKELNTLNVQSISKKTGIPVYSVYRYIRELRKDGKIK